MEKLILGIDIGGTGIKGAIVDTIEGKIVSEKIKVATPIPATPDKMLGAVKKLIAGFEWAGKPVGMGFPSTIKKGVVMNASNIDASWINYPLKENWSKELKSPIVVLNDADAAGLAEVSFGSAKNMEGTVLFLTLGTGIGSAIFVQGHLIPNTELGHVIVNKKVGEKMASNMVRENKKMTWKTYGKVLSQYLQRIEFLLNPDHIIIGGGISKKFDLYKPYIVASANIIPAILQNDAGIIGAACAFTEKDNANI